RGDISVVRAPRARCGEGLVARRVDEHDRMPVHFNLVGADVLSDGADLLRSDVRFADRVEEARLSVVDVPHHGHDGRPCLQLLVLVASFLLSDRYGRTPAGPSFLRLRLEA